MAETIYRDLAEFGLPLVTPQDPAFATLVHDIENRPQPFGSWPTGELSTAAVLLNQSGKAIVALAYIWRYKSAGGKTRTNRHSNLGSSVQMDVLSGRAEVIRDLGSFILPGSKRLITPAGMFGNNLDVLPPDFVNRGGGYVGAGGGGSFRTGPEEAIAQIELKLDVAILEDGMCVGPDESGLFESMNEDLEQERTTAQKIVAALRNGASDGQVFELLQPLARRWSSAGGIEARDRIRSPFLMMFAKTAIDRLINNGRAELLAWFDEIAQSPPLRLHRPS